jgi:hypothetical protein
MLDGDGHSVPVIVLELESDRGMHMPLHVEQPSRRAHGPGRSGRAPLPQGPARHRAGVCTQRAPGRVATHIHTHQRERDGAMSRFTLIALTGPAGAGKDSVADYLVRTPAS